MKKMICLVLILFSSLGFSQSDNYNMMLKELKVINSEYRSEYEKNPLIKEVLDKTMKYRLDPKLGKNEFVSKNEKQGLTDFETLQDSRDKETITVYEKYQSQKYVDMMVDYDNKRKELRINLMNKRITWRQFSDDLEDLIIRNRSKESDFRDKKPVHSIVS